MFKIRSLQLIRGSNPDDIAAYDLRPNHGLPFLCAWVKVGNHLWRARVGRVRSPAKICKQLGNRQMTLRIFQSLRLAKLLSRKTEGDARRHPAQRVDHRRWRGDLSSCVLDGPRRHRLKAHRLTLRERPDAGMAEDEESQFRAAVMSGFVSWLSRPTS